MQNNNKNAKRLPPLKLKLRGKPGRGSLTPEGVIDIMCDNWWDLKNELNRLN